jgi:hypothetical protein
MSVSISMSLSMTMSVSSPVSMLLSLWFQKRRAAHFATCSVRLRREHPRTDRPGVTTDYGT